MRDRSTSKREGERAETRQSPTPIDEYEVVPTQSAFASRLTTVGLVLTTFALLGKLLIMRRALFGPEALSVVGLIVDVAAVGVAMALISSARRPLWWAAAMDAIISVVSIAILAYVTYFQQLPTLVTLAATWQLGEAGASVGELLGPAELLFFVDVLVLFAMAPFAGRRPESTYRQRVWRTTVGVASFVVFAGALATIALGAAPNDGLELASSRGLTAWTVSAPLQLGDTTGQARAVSAEDLGQTRIDGLMGVKRSRIAEAPVAGAAQGANVIVIQVEALQTTAMNAEIAGEPITPRLNEIAGKGWYFPNTISQAGRGATADVEFVEATSLYPPAGDPVSVTLADRELPSLPRALGEEGYDTVTMHVNDARFWNRTQLYPAIGFGGYVDRTYFGTDDTIGWGQSDEMFFRLASDPISRMSSSGAPFYAQLVTITSHHPFAQIPADRQPLALPAELEGTTVGRYVQSINFADRVLGDFVDNLEANGLLENTVLVIYGDHTALNPGPADPSEALALTAFAGPDYTRLASIKVPLIVRLPRQKSGRTVETVVGQSDIAPTLAELLGVSLGNRPVFGASVFRQRGDAVVPTSCRSPFGSFVTYAGEYQPAAVSSGYELTTTEGTTVEAGPADQGLIARAKALVELNDAYARSLPKRVGAPAIADGAKLPPAGRKALKELQGSE